MCILIYTHMYTYSEVHINIAFTHIGNEYLILLYRYIIEHGMED